MSKMIAVAPGADAQIVSALATVLGTQGRMLQFFGVGAFIIDAPPALVNTLASIPGIAHVTEGVIANVEALAPTAELKTLLKAWNLQFDPSFIAARASRSLLWFVNPAPCQLVTAPPTFQ